MTDTNVFNARVPAEWEPQECVWLAWPHQRKTWPGRFENIPSFFALWARQIAESTPVRVLAADDVAEECQSLLQGARGIQIVDVPTNDCWIRDYGPTFVTSGADLHAVDWRYNAWGGKYPPWDLDQAAAGAICRWAGIPYALSNLCLEGGAIELDGMGRLLTTRSCLVSDTRNPGWSVDQIQNELICQLGVSEIVMLTGGLEGDDTDGHIDQLVRFIDRANVVVAICEDTHDRNYEVLQGLLLQLQTWGEQTTPRVSVHRLPIPPARRIDGQRVPESYCNFLRLGRERMLVPTFDAKSDQHAVGLLRELSGAEIIGIDCREVVWGLGALHCASREQPRVAG